MKARLRRFCSYFGWPSFQDAMPVRARQRPPRPEDWMLTLDDLFSELMAGRRAMIGSPEREWAIDYELSLLPASVRFPHQGDVYRPRDKITLSASFPGNAPASGTEVSVDLSPEDQLRVFDPLSECELGAHLRPVDYAALRQRFIPAQSDDYFFYIKTTLLNESFWLVEDGRGDAPIPNPESQGALR